MSAGTSPGGSPAISDAKAVTRTACPSSRLIATATASAKPVHTGAAHANADVAAKPALAVRHHNVR